MNYTICGPLWPASFTGHNVFKIHPPCSIYQSFVAYPCWMILHCVDRPYLHLPIHPCWILSFLGAIHTHSLISPIQDPRSSSVQGLVPDFSRTWILRIRSHSGEIRAQGNHLWLRVSACCLSGYKIGRIYISNISVILLQIVSYLKRLPYFLFPILIKYNFVLLLNF